MQLHTGVYRHRKKSALKIDSGKKIPRCTGESNLHPLPLYGVFSPPFHQLRGYHFVKFRSANPAQNWSIFFYLKKIYFESSIWILSLMQMASHD